MLSAKQIRSDFINFFKSKDAKPVMFGFRFERNPVTRMMGRVYENGSDKIITSVMINELENGELEVASTENMTAGEVVVNCQKGAVIVAQNIARGKFNGG